MGNHYKLDIARYTAYHKDKMGKNPTSVEIESLERIVEWCNQTYIQGWGREPFKMPLGLPVYRLDTKPHVAICLNCGEVAMSEASIDENGLHMICNHCNASIDIEIVTDEGDSEYMS